MEVYNEHSDPKKIKKASVSNKTHGSVGGYPESVLQKLRSASNKSTRGKPIHKGVRGRKTKNDKVLGSLRPDHFSGE